MESDRRSFRAVEYKVKRLVKLSEGYKETGITALFLIILDIDSITHGDMPSNLEIQDEFLGWAKDDMLIVRGLLVGITNVRFKKD